MTLTQSLKAGGVVIKSKRRVQLGGRTCVTALRQELALTGAQNCPVQGQQASEEEA